ncbi:MAG TPA: SgcJ/EcaC family oxidoreductase [Bacteroidales bacterium]|nr:SgcJ/EcaC family oxidoreductase [Bacteroidales bacterium]
MSGKKLFIFAVILYLPAIGFCQNVDETEKVKQVIEAFQDDFNNGSFKNAADYTTSDWVHINPGGGIASGRDEVLKEVRSVHQTFLKNVTMKIEWIDIRFLAPSVALAEVVHSISPYELPKGTIHTGEKQTKTYVVIKSGDKWLLTLDQNTIKGSPQ